jgi:hypothetical protein
VRCKFSVVYIDFRINHPKLYENIERWTLNWKYYYMFNKLDEKEDSYYLKYIFCPRKCVYGYVKKSPFNNNYLYYESEID